MANNLKIFRCIKGFTQTDVSKYLDISVNSYCNKELGNRSFSLDEAYLLSKLFNVSIEEIFFDNKVFNKNTKMNFI